MGNNIIHIFYIKQTEKLPDEIFYKFLLKLPEQFKEQILAYKHWQSAQASLLGKILLTYGFKELNLDYSLHDIQVDAKDRPFINDSIDFNISHSGEYVIAAISTNAKVGIDIEKHRKLKMNIAERYFDGRECNEIDTSSNSSLAFFDLWAIKESAIKCDGRGVEVLSKTHKQYQETNLNTVICDAITYYYQQIVIEENYSCCVCGNEEFKTKLTKLQPSDLLNI